MESQNDIDWTETIRKIGRGVFTQNLGIEEKFIVDITCIRFQFEHHLSMLNTVEGSALEDDLDNPAFRSISIECCTWVTKRGCAVVIGHLGRELPNLTTAAQIGCGRNQFDIGSTDHPHRLINHRTLQQWAAWERELQREIAQVIRFGDVQINLEDSIGIRLRVIVHARCGPCPVDWGVLDRLQCVVNQTGLDGCILVAIPSWQGVQLEVSCSNHGDVVVGTCLGKDVRLIACEVELRVREVDSDTICRGLILAVPGPVVVEPGFAAIHGRDSCIAGLLTALEDAVTVEVNLQCHGVLDPWCTCTIGHIANHTEGLACVHLWDNLTALITAWVTGVNLTTGWSIKITTILHDNEPMC